LYIQAKSETIPSYINFDIKRIKTKLEDLRQVPPRAFAETEPERNSSSSSM